jgi:orotate phosphoribosyltransferase
MSSSRFRVETTAERANRRWREEQGRRTALVERAMTLGLSLEAAVSLDREASAAVVEEAALALARSNDAWSTRLADEQATLNQLQVDLAALTARHGTLREWADEIGFPAGPPADTVPVAATAVEAALAAQNALAEDN